MAQPNDNAKRLEPDRDQLEIFVEALFRYATTGDVSLRSFYEDRSQPLHIVPYTLNGAGFVGLIDIAEKMAAQSANTPEAVVFCPPIATFRNGRKATEKDIVEGLALSVELDAHPHQARAKLEQILGPATLAVRSGGRWSDESGAVHDKLHLHWRLSEPATEERLTVLKQARKLATRLAGGDPSNVPIVHPIRWPGSWHRKAEPRLCEIESANPDREIILELASNALEAASPHQEAKSNGHDGFDRLESFDRLEWDEAFEKILSGDSYHPTLTPLAASMAARGVPEPVTDNVLRSLLINSRPIDAERERRRRIELSKLSETVASAYEKFGRQAPPAPVSLPFINMSSWDSEPIPEQEWVVFNRIPRRQCVLFSGEGAAGKSTIQLHTSAAHVLGKEWLGSLPEVGPALFIDAEDDVNVIRRRLAAITKHYGTSFAELIEGGLHLMSLAGHDAVLATTSRSGKIEPTPLYNQIIEAIGDIKPISIGIASSANVYAGSEIDRSQVQQFISLMTRLAIIANGSVTLISHPSLAGIATDTGLSGNTQWHNAVRARFYLKGVKPEEGEQPDSDLRELVFKKNNYGPVSESLLLRYSDGLFLPVPGATGSFLDRAAQEMRADEVFIELLRRFATANRTVSSRPSPTYGPTLFAREDEAKRSGIKSKALEAAMNRLFKTGKIWNEPCGKPSRPTYRLALKV